MSFGFEQRVSWLPRVVPMRIANPFDIVFVFFGFHTVSDDSFDFVFFLSGDEIGRGFWKGRTMNIVGAEGGKECSMEDVMYLPGGWESETI